MPEQVLLLVSVLTPIVAGIVELIKHVGLNTKYAPLMAVAVGVALAALYTFGSIELSMRLWAGVLAGLAASGFYSNVKEQIKKAEGQ
ncbi:hypothetical protein KVG29_08905 [Caldicoprobacter algeriensis]|uniref:holin n=1 Tax=Caldicoprobacter algeriensis TaxID=699281 RepID=UPI002079A00F|nr:holin [Caldicoprobacter algeriensis]MCM8901338.1 hypothetical protein [Caldicoprobacter algeriensis]